MANQEVSPIISKEVVVFQEQASKALATLNTYKEILKKAEAAFKAMPKVVDEETKANAFKLRDKVTRASKDLNEMRSPFTRELTKIQKEFTGTEGGFDSIGKDIEAQCDTYARAELAKARKEQDRIDNELRAKQQAIEYVARVRALFHQRVEAFLDVTRKGTGDLVDKVTKGNLATTKTRLSADPKWNEKHVTFFNEVPDWVTDVEQFKVLAAEEFEACKANYLAKARAIMDDALRIVDIAVTNKDEAQRLQELAAQEQTEQAQQEVSEAEKMKDVELALAELDMVKVEAPKVRVKMKIEILSNDAWLKLMSWWYVNDPDAKTIDCSKKTFAQLKTFAENRANKEGEALEHESIRWVEDVKAR